MTKRREAIKKSIAHWKRMIEWAQTQPIGDDADQAVMECAIYETWTAWYCSLCHYTEDQGDDMDCKFCPLWSRGYTCVRFDSPWSRVHESKSWGEWLENAKVMLKTLEDL
jgi:hypothetical protein